MKCPKCASTSFERANGVKPVERSGVLFRQHRCLSCKHLFLSAQLVVTDEMEPVARLDAVLRAFMDESDARAAAEIEGAESLETIT